MRSIASQSQINTLLNSLPLYPYSIAKAKQEMAQSAYPRGFTTTVLAYDSGTSLNVFQVIAAELGKIGIRVQLKTTQVTAWGTVETGPTSKRMTSFSGGGCFNPDPSTYGDWLGSKNTQPGSWNFTDYTPAAVDNLLAQGVATSNPAQRFAVYSQLFQRLQADVPYVGLFISDEAIALSPKFTWLDYNQWYWTHPYALDIRPAA
jgi:peptide/nickel transport system substrate-binding protein